MGDTALVNISGYTFGKWTVVSRAATPPNRRREAWWNVQCSCGALSAVRGNSLRAGQTKGCKACSAKARGERRKASNHGPRMRPRSGSSGFIVYVAQHQESGLVYIGCTGLSLRRRRTEHLARARSVRGDSGGRCRRFHAALRDGPDLFVWSELAWFETLGLALEAEHAAMIAYRSRDLNFGFNLQGSGAHPERHLETRALSAAATRANQPMKRPEVRDKMAHSKRSLSPASAANVMMLRALGSTQSFVAWSFGTSQQTVSDVERGRFGYAGELASFYGVTAP